MHEQRSESWHAERRGRITGSMVGALLDLSPYMTKEQAIRSMVRDYHGAESEFVGGPHIDWGVANEETAIAQFELETGLTVTKTGFHAHPNGWLGASPDGLIGDGAVLENKCPFGIRNKKPPVFKTVDEVPHYYAQMQIEMECTGRIAAYFNQWTPNGSQYVIVRRDDKWIAEHLPILEAIYFEIQGELDNPEHLEPLRVEVNTNYAKILLDEYDQLSEAIDNATERKKEVLAELVKASKEKNALIYGRKLTKVEKKGSVSYAKVVKEHCPDVDLEKYRGNSSEYWKLS